MMRCSLGFASDSTECTRATIIALAEDLVALRAAVDVHDLDDLDRTTLYQRARDLDVPGRSNMSRAELIEALRPAADG